MAEGYLSPSSQQQQVSTPQAQSQPADSGVKNIESMLTVNAMKVMYSDQVWPDIKNMIGKGEEGIVQAMVLVSINILDLAKQKGYKPSNDELMIAAEELAGEMVEIALAMGVVQGDPEEIEIRTLGQAIADIAQKRPDLVDLQQLEQVAAQASPEEQAQVQSMLGQPQPGVPQHGV